jgi:hypothetical protein
LNGARGKLGHFAAQGDDLAAQIGDSFVRLLKSFIEKPARLSASNQCNNGNHRDCQNNANNQHSQDFHGSVPPARRERMPDRRTESAAALANFMQERA